MKRIMTIVFALLFVLACQDPKDQPAQTALPAAAKAQPAPKAEPAPKPKSKPEQASTLRHIVILTGGAKETDSLPLIVALHGLGNTPEGFAKLFQTFDTPARVLLPEGPLRARRQGASWFRIQLKHGKLRLNEKQIVEACEAIVRLTEQVRREHPSRGKPVLTGFSQGGILSYAMAVQHPELFALIAPVSGWLPPGLVPEGQAQDPKVPVRALHGKADPIVRYEPTRKLAERLKAQGYDVDLKAYPEVKHTISGAMRAELLRLLREAAGEEGENDKTSAKSDGAGGRPAPAIP